MNTQDLAFNRLLKKLSALRATLVGDERNLLDRLITGPIDEVGAHSMSVTPISPVRNSIKASSPDETRASSMKVSAAKSSVKASSPDETRASSMKVSATKASVKASSPDETRASAMTFQIVFDPTKNEYQRNS